MFECLGADDVIALADFVADLKSRITASDLDQRLKLALLALLTQMQGVFETYEMLGEQDLDTTVTLWAGRLMQFHSELKGAEDKNLITGLFGLLGKFWDAMKLGGQVIENIKKFTDLLPPAA